MVRLLVDVNPKGRRRDVLALTWPGIFGAVKGADIEVTRRPGRVRLSDATAMAEVGLSVLEAQRRPNTGDEEQPKDEG